MAKVLITDSLRSEILKKFSKSQTLEIITLLRRVEQNPHKGKALGHVGNIVIKELKYGGFRFYFITDGHVLKFGTDDELAVLLIKFIKMSDKKTQKDVISGLKAVLKSLGFEGF
jgi:hypothetical protein